MEFLPSPLEKTKTQPILQGVLQFFWADLHWDILRDDT